MNRNLIRLFTVLVVLTAAMIGLTGTAFAQGGDTTGQGEPLAPDSIPRDLDASLLAGRMTTPAVPNLSSRLDNLYSTWTNSRTQAAEMAEVFGFELSGSRVKVMFIMHDDASAQSVIDALPAYGGTVTASYSRWVDAWVPVESVRELAQLPGVSLLRTPIPLMPADPEPETQSGLASVPRAGTYLSQGVAASNADDFHAAGITGSGVNVAIIDYFLGYPQAQALGELPASIDIYQTADTTSSSHGTAVAEIVYDMAPGINMTIGTPSSATEMASFIVGLSNEGNDVISSSIGWYNAEPGDGTGVVSQAITTARNNGTLYVQAAGNQAMYHWDGTFTSKDGDSWHEWNTPDSTELNLLNQAYQVPAGALVYLNFRWNDWPVSDQDYNLYLMRWTGSAWVVVAASENLQTGTQPPTETIVYYTSQQAYYGVGVWNESADGTQVLDLMGHNAPYFEFTIEDRSLIDPATGPYSFSVAALDATSPYPLEAYSSWGPTHGPGLSLTGGNDKPRISGYANVDTWAYGPGVFNGTSSATPHVAGAAALIKSIYSGYTPDNLMSHLEGDAIDMGTAGYDYQYGAGRLSLTIPAPELSDPANGTTSFNSTPLFEWDPVSTASRYQFQVDDDPAFGSPAQDIMVSGTSYTAATLTGNTYYWRTRVNAVGATGEWSDVWSYTSAPPSSLAASTTYETQVDLQWVDNSPDETTFRIERSPNGSTSWVEIGNVVANQTTYSDEGLECGTAYYYRTRAMGGSDYSVYSNTLPVTTSACSLSAATLIAPDDDSVIDIGPVDFSWSAIAGAQDYLLQIDNNASFNSPEQEIATANTTSQVALPEDELYYWRVRGFGAGATGSEWSEVWSFTLGELKFGLPGPTLQSPKDWAITKDTTPNLKWKKVKGAVQYHIQITTDPAFGTVVESYPVETSFTPGGLTYGFYYWRVRARDAAGEWGDWSAARRFSLTLLKSPKNAQHITDATPKFSWNKADNADSYTIEVATDADFTNVVFTEVTEGTSATPATDLLAGDYFWRVRVDTKAYTAWMPTWTFTVTPKPPQKPDLTSPVNGWTTSDPTPTFQWGTVADGYTYQIQIDDKSNFSSPLQDVELAPGQTTYTADSLPVGGKLYWRVRALNSAGVAGSWSKKYNFNLEAIERPDLVDPANNAVVPDNTPLLSWASVTGAVQYQVQIDDDKKFGSPLQDMTVAGTSTTASALPDGKFYWQVRAVNSAGVAGSWSKYWAFTVDTTGPDSPRLNSPKDMSGTADSTPTLKWKKPAASGGDYRVQLSDTDDFSSLLIDEMATKTQYSVTDLQALDFGTYYWRVMAEDKVGNWGAWSPAFSFTVTIQKSPKDGSGSTNTQPTFAWNKVSNAIRYRFEIDDDPAFGSVNDSYEGTNRSYKPATPLAVGVYYWRVLVDVGAGFNVEMPAWFVTITPKPPSKVNLSTPSNKTLTRDNTPTLTWQVTDGASTYRVQVDNNSDFSSPEVDETGVSVLEYTPTALADGKQYWRVMGINTVGATGKWSAKWTFTIDTVAPDVPELVAPTSTASVTNKKLKFEWTKIPDAQEYEIQIDLDPNFPVPYIELKKSTKYSPPTTFSRGLYYWRVRAVDKAGNTSDWSTVGSYQIVAGVTAIDLPSADAVQVVGLPYVEAFEADGVWVAVGGWSLDSAVSRSGSSWFINAAQRGQTATLTMNVDLDLTGASTPLLTWWQKLDLDSADAVRVEVSVDGGSAWLPLLAQPGAVTDWQQRQLDLTAFAGFPVRLRFVVTTAAVDTASVGVWLDELVVMDVPVVPQPDATEEPPANDILPVAPIPDVVPAAPTPDPDVEAPSLPGDLDGAPMDF